MYRKVVLVLVIAVGAAVSGIAAKVQLVYSDWHLAEPVWAQSLKEAIALFEQEHPNIEVILSPISLAEKAEQYLISMAGGKGPDIVHLQAHAELYLLASRGYLLDLTPYIEKEGPDFLKAWPQNVLDVCQINGRYYTLPGDMDPILLVYNAKMFREVGLDPNKPPSTWDEFLTYAQQLTRDLDGDGINDVWGFAFPGSISPSFQLRFMPFLYSFGGDFLTPDGKCCALNSPEAKEAFQFLIDLNKVMAPDVSALGAGKCRELMAFEKVGMLLEGPWARSIINDINPELGAYDVLWAAPVPVKTGYTGQARTTAELTTWSINANTKHPDEAWLLIKFLTSKSIQEKFFLDNGVIPSRLDVSGGDGHEINPRIASDTRWSAVFAQELPHVRIVPQMEEWPEMIERVNVAAQEAWTGQKSALQALRDAYMDINRLLGGEQCPSF